ncbi:MAG: transcription antitermination factor NusB [Psittacicella sp.]
MQKQINSRTKAREAVLKALYSWKYTNDSSFNIIKFFKEDEKALKIANKDYFETLFSHIVSLKSSLDEQIIGIVSPRKLEELDSIEYLILLLAVDEITYQNIPEKVAINEAIELSKIYGSDNSYKFINATLDKFIKSL